jgi:hypothetical protein
VTSISRIYLDGQASMVSLLSSLDESEWATPVPCTPLWTVRDVLSHVAGITDDITNGRTEGAASDPWTAAQVERWRDADPAELIQQWSGQIGTIADLLERVGEARPSFDCWTHEQDIRHALGRGQSMPQPVLDTMVSRFAGAPAGPPITITFADESQVALPGEGEPISLDGITQYEFVRSRFGRRSREQVAGYDWSQPPTDEMMSNWFVFGPSELPIVE